PGYYFTLCRKNFCSLSVASFLSVSLVQIPTALRVKLVNFPWPALPVPPPPQRLDDATIGWVRGAVAAVGALAWFVTGFQTVDPITHRAMFVYNTAAHGQGPWVTYDSPRNSFSSAT